MRPARETRPAAQTTTRREPVRATALPGDALAEARATYRRAAMARALDEMFTDRDTTRDHTTREDF